MKKMLCLALTLVMLCALFSGCGEQKKLLGTWECTLDLSAMAGKLLAQEFDVNEFCVTARLTFLEDNTFRLELDPQKLTETVAALEKDLAAGLIQLLQEQLQEQGLNISVEELLTQSGLELSDLTEQLLQSFEADRFLEELTEQLALEGFYQVKGDKLLFCADAEMKLDEIYTLYTVEEGVLTVSAHVGINSFLGDHPILGTTPVEFIKVSQHTTG